MRRGNGNVHELELGLLDMYPDLRNHLRNVRAGVGDDERCETGGDDNDNEERDARGAVVAVTPLLNCVCFDFVLRRISPESASTGERVERRMYVALACVFVCRCRCLAAACSQDRKLLRTGGGRAAMRDLFCFCLLYLCEASFTDDIKGRWAGPAGDEHQHL
nr:uncharacterized protein CTRU02_00943 [Colletotrichum truncatum]KAF6800538.1 hypothetical protein CTRU02_00943 [Colletotrichum truncatum]